MDGLIAGLDALRPDPWGLALAVAADLAIGDPVYGWHPIRLVGRALGWTEARLRAMGADGYGGGVALFVVLAGAAIASLVAVVALVVRLAPWLAWLVHVWIVYSLLALGELVHHVRRIDAAVSAGDVPAARAGVGALAGRDTDPMDGPACRRAGVESLGENLTDGFVSPVVWYAIGGLPGLVVFKVVSTMDSMVGYRTARYLRFGWCGARLDDVMNWLPARLTWLVLSLVAVLTPSASGSAAWSVGLAQHSLVPGPNAGWSEAGLAGALQRRLVGPIWQDGVLITELWLGRPTDPPLATAGDLDRGVRLAVSTGLAVVALALALVWSASGGRG